MKPLLIAVIIADCLLSPSLRMTSSTVSPRSRSATLTSIVVPSGAMTRKRQSRLLGYVEGYFGLVRFIGWVRVIVPLGHAEIEKQCNRLVCFVVVV